MAMQTSKEVHAYLVDHLAQLGATYNQLGLEIAAQEAAIGIRVQDLHDILLELVTEKVAEPVRQHMRGDLVMRLDSFMLAQSDVMRDHASELDIAGRHLQSFNASVERLADARQETMTAANTFMQAQDALHTKVVTDPEIQKLRRAATDAHSALRTARSEHAQQETTTSDELKVYENHALFMHLVGAHFGTPAYRPRWFMWPVHRVIARAVDFDDKNHHYTHLTRRMRPDTEKMQALKASLDDAVLALKSAEAEAETDILSPARGQLSGAWLRETDVRARVNVLVESLYDLRVPEVSGNRPQAYTAALHSYVTFEATDVFSALMEQSATDPRWTRAAVLVTEINATHNALGGMQKELARTGLHIGTVTQVIRDFVAHGYHLPIFFYNMDMDSLVHASFEGHALKILAEHAWMSTDQSQHYIQHYIPVQPDVLLSPPKPALVVKPSNGNGGSASARAESEHPVAELCAY